MAVTSGTLSARDPASTAKRRVVVPAAASSPSGSINKVVATTPKTGSGSSNSSIFRASPSAVAASANHGAVSASAVPSSVRARVLGYSPTGSRGTSSNTVRSPSPSHLSPVSGAAPATLGTPPSGSSSTPGGPPASTSTRSLQQRIRAASTEPTIESASPSADVAVSGSGRAVRTAGAVTVDNVNKPASAKPPLSPGTKRARTVFPSVSAATARVDSSLTVGPSPSSLPHVRVRAQSQAPSSASAGPLKASVSQTNLAAGPIDPQGPIGLLPSPTLSGSSWSSSSSSNAAPAPTPFAAARTRLKSSTAVSYLPTAGLGLAGSPTPQAVFARTTTSNAAPIASKQTVPTYCSPLSRSASPVRAATSGLPHTVDRRPASPIRASTVASSSSSGVARAPMKRPASPVRQVAELDGPSTPRPRAGLPHSIGNRPRSPFKPSPSSPAQRRPHILPHPAEQPSSAPERPETFSHRGGHSQTTSSVSSSSTIAAPVPSPQQAIQTDEADSSTSSVSAASSSSDEECEEAALSYAFSSSGVSGASSSASALSSASTAATSTRGAASPPLLSPETKVAGSAIVDTPVASRYSHLANVSLSTDNISPMQSSPLAQIASPSPAQVEQGTLADRAAMEKEHRDAKVRRKVRSAWQIQVRKR